MIVGWMACLGLSKSTILSKILYAAKQEYYVSGGKSRKNEIGLYLFQVVTGVGQGQRRFVLIEVVYRMKLILY